MNQKKYLVLNSDTFIWNKHNQFLMYNCESKQSFFFYGVDVISEYIFKLQNINNLYVVEINIDHLKKTEFAKWISILVEKNMGRLLEFPVNHKIIGFPPLLNLQCDVDRIDKEEGRDIGEIVGLNFNELSINIGGDGISPELYKQILYPIKSEDVMDIRMLDNFLNSVNLQYLQVINLVGELFSYEYYQQLVLLLMKLSIHKHLYMTSSYVCRHIHELNELELFTFDLYIYYDNLDELIFLGKNLNVNKYIVHWIYLLHSEKQINELTSIRKILEPKSIEVRPIFTGENILFFKKYVFASEEDFKINYYDKQDIFAHQVMNTNFWGKLYILPNGYVYSNLNVPPLGTLENNVYDLISSEMKSHRAWRLTRDCLSPCKDCLYRYLCPSPSNYEFVIGKPNLCHIHP